MTEQVRTTKKSDLGEKFETQIEELMDHAEDEFDDLKEANETHWMMPELGGWSGDLFDWEGMKEPFLRKDLNDMYEAATEDPWNPGRSGDLIITTTQIAYLASMERAFRARHTQRFPRSVAHVLGRRNVQKMDKQGSLSLAALEYVKGIILQTSGEDDV